MYPQRGKSLQHNAAQNEIPDKVINTMLDQSSKSTVYVKTLDFLKFISFRNQTLLFSIAIDWVSRKTSKYQTEIKWVA